MLEGKGRFWRQNGKFYVYLPSEVVKDSMFPLKGKKGEVNIRINNKQLIIEE